MSEEEATESTYKPQVSREMVERYKELSTIMKEFRKTLGPRKEELFNNVAEIVDWDEVYDLIEVGGGESLTTSGTIEGKKVSVIFRLTGEAS